MLSVNEVFYNNNDDPVRVLGSSNGHGSRRLYREDSYRGSGYDSRYPSDESEYSYRNSDYSRSSHSPRRGRHESRFHLSDLLRRHRSSHSPPAYRQGAYLSRSDSRNAISPPGRYHGSHHTTYPTYHSNVTYPAGYASSDVYHGQHTATVPRTYASNSYHDALPYGGQTVQLKVSLCCEACEDRIKNRLLDVEGVHTVTCDSMRQKVVVTGVAAPAEILRVSKECFKNSKFWRD